MATGQSGLSDATVFVSLALFGVWMYRQKVPNLSGSPSRWGAFFGALTGKYTISSNVGVGSSSGGSSAPSTGGNGTVGKGGIVTVPTP